MYATLAQLAEHSPCKRKVVSSILTGSSRKESNGF